MESTPWKVKPLRGSSHKEGDIQSLMDMNELKDVQPNSFNTSFYPNAIVPLWIDIYELVPFHQAPCPTNNHISSYIQVPSFPLILPQQTKKKPQKKKKNQDKRRWTMWS